MTDDQRPFDSKNKSPKRLDINFALQATGLGIWEVDPATNQVMWDDQCRALFSLIRDNDISYQQAVLYIHPDDAERVNQAFLWAMNSASTGVYDQTFRTLGADDGQLRWVRFAGRAYFTEAGDLYRFAGIGQEVTFQIEGLQEAQASQTYLLTLSDRLRWLRDPVQIQYEAACVLGEQLNANRVGYAETQADNELVAVTRNYTQGVEGIEGVYRYGDYGLELLQRMQAGETVVRPDIANDSSLTDAEKTAHAVLQLGATLNVPLVKEGQLVAIIFVHYQQAHAFSRHEVTLVQKTAERIWSAVERARAEEALRESEQQFRLLADALPQAIWVTDTKGNVTFLNQWWIDYSGISFEPTTAWKVADDSLHPEDAPILLAAFTEALQQGNGFEVEQRNRSASGEYRWFLNAGVPYHDPKTGQITQWVGMSVDIDDRKRAEQALRESEARLRQLSEALEQLVQQRTEELATANQELTATNEELAANNEEYVTINEELEEANFLLNRSNDNLQQFAYVASHDLQEPLRKVQQFGDLLKTRYNDSAGEELLYVERMQSAAARMSGLIKDLLNFSRITTQYDTSSCVVLNQVVDEVLMDLELLRAETQAQVEVAALPTLEGDARQLGQLFQNLLSNALKFRRPDVAPHIQIKSDQVSADQLPAGVKPSRSAQAYYRIEVIDNGIGFEEKYLDRIFQVFQRLHGKSEYAGTGIGLAICEKVVANHGGAITAHSRPGQGATFTLYLPE